MVRIPYCDGAAAKIDGADLLEKISVHEAYMVHGFKNSAHYEG